MAEPKQKKVKPSDVGEKGEKREKGEESLPVLPDEYKKIGIIGALPAEIEKITSMMKNRQEKMHGKYFTFYTGTWNDREIVVARCGVGMVFSSSVATIMIQLYGAEVVICTGVGGGLKHEHEVGDIIVAEDSVHYEMNCQGFKNPWLKDYEHKRGELPFLDGVREFKSCPNLMELAMAAKLDGLKATRKTGRIVSGSEFVTVQRKMELEEVWKQTENPDVVEMEGAGIAQICHAFDIPFVIIRAVSDTLKGDANEDFNKFCDEVANHTFPIIAHILEHHD